MNNLSKPPIEERRNLRKQLERIVNCLADWIELLISILLVLVIIYLLYRLVVNLRGDLFVSKKLIFTDFLSDAFNLIIGTEFIRMLCRKTPDTIIEVLMFATARQLLVMHNSIQDNLIGVIAISILLIIRKHVMTENNMDSSSGLIQDIRNKFLKNTDAS